MTTALGTGLRRAAARLAPDPDPTPDGDLLARFLATRDEQAFALLVRRHGPMVLGTCRRVLGNADDADDAFQAAFVVLVRKAGSLTDRTCVGNFLYGVAFHTALKARAMATKRRVKEAKATRPDQPDSGELSRAMDEELAKLPDKYREPVVLCELEGVSRKDAAARLGIPEGTISSRLATAHRMLAKRLTAKGFAAAGVTAVLTNQAFAVPDKLAEAALRAAVDGPPAAVTQLASEVSKMLLWNKLKAGAVVAGVLLACGLGFGLTANALAADEPKVKAPVPTNPDDTGKPADKKPDDAKLLQGKWVTKGVTWDPPHRVGPNEVFHPANVELTFDGTDLTWVSFTLDDPKNRSTQTKPFTLDQTAKPKELTSGDMDCIYELDGDKLKVAMYFLTSGRPKGFNAKDSPPGKGHVILIELARVKDEKKDEADKGYSLKDGEVLKLIPAPFADEREEIYTKFDAAGGIRPAPLHDTRLMAVTVADGKPVSANAFTDRKSPGAETAGKPLTLFVQHALRTDMAKVGDPNWLLESTILDADLVVKKGAASADLIAALEKELSAKCGVKLSLKYEEVEREVVVISGKHTLNPGPKEADDGRVFGQASVVHLYATDKVDTANSLMDYSRGLPGELAKFVGRPVIDESDLSKNDVPVKMTFHVQYPETDKTRAADRDPAKVLQNVSNQTGLVFKLGKQKVKALVVAKADDPKAKPPEKKADEPAWKGEFRKAYGLKDGELVRRVPLPHPDSRAKMFEDLFPGRQGNIPTEKWFNVFQWKGDWLDAKFGQSTMPVEPEAGVSLVRLLEMSLNIPAPRIDDQSLLNRNVTGDWVVRAGADPEKVAAQLETILREECALPVSLSFRDGEEEVYVLSGTYKAAPLDTDKADRLEVFAKYRNDGTFGGGGNGTMADLMAALEKHTGTRMVLGDVKGPPKNLSWHFNDRKGPFTAKEGAEDRNPALVLANIAAQTGLDVTTETRKVRRLVVAKAEK